VSILKKEDVIMRIFKKKKYRKIGQDQYINQRTGEVETFLVLSPSSTDTNFIKIFIPFIEEIFNNKKLLAGPFRLLLWVVKRMDWNTLEVYLREKDVLTDLDITARTYYRWKKILLEEGLLLQDNMEKKKYYLKPYSIIKGTMQKVG
jgi:hypothetical protein